MIEGRKTSLSTKRFQHAGTIGRVLTQLGAWTANPVAFLILVLYAGAWIVLDRTTFDWHAAATMGTWFMTLIIQRAEHRDTQAIHGKLDELLHAQAGADNAVTRLDDGEPEDIAEHRRQARQNDE